MAVARNVAIGRNMTLRRCRRNMKIALGAMRVSATFAAWPDQSGRAGAHPWEVG